MTAVLTLALSRARGRLVSLSLGIAVFLFLVGLSYAAVDQNTVRQLYESLPPALRAFSGAGDIASPGGYLGSSFIHPVPLVIQGAVAISMGTAAARDLESGLGELMLSRHLSRRAWLGAHAIATGLGVTLVGLAAGAGALAAMVVVEDLGDISPADLVPVVAGSVLLFSAIAAIALLATALARTGGAAVGWAAGVVVVMYALNYLARVWRSAEPLGPLSVFHYFDPGVVLSRGVVDGTDVLTLAAVAVAATFVAHLLIARREVGG